MKRSSILITTMSILCVILLFHGSTMVSARELVYENVIWISGFEDPIGSMWSNTTAGDASDITATATSGEANYMLLGEEKSYNLSSDKPLNNDTWIPVDNPSYRDRPDDYNVTSEGFYASHYWGDEYGERADQSTSIHFETNITLEETMTDYTITSATVSAEINASVFANNGANAGIEVPGDPTEPPGQYADYDYIRYYLLVSDLPKNKVYEIAQYQTAQDNTYDLGSDSRGVMDEFNETLLFTVSEANLKFFLTSVLRTDAHNFTFTVGFRIFAEDNWNSDDDYFDYVWIKNVDLNFTYQKNMNQLTTLSWNGIGNSLNSTNVLIKDASFEFTYKIDAPWPTSDSPNSEFRMFVSDKQITETIKLSTVTSSFQNSTKYNVTSLISLDVNITVSIQVYIGDNFDLASPIIISIDDVILKLTYIVILQDPSPTNLRPYIYSSAGLLAALAAGIGLYEGIFKFPKTIRVVRGLRRKIRRGRASKPIPGDNSRTIGRNIFEEEKRHLNKVSSKPQHSQPSKKAAPTKDTSGYKDVSQIEEKKMPENNIKGSEKNA